MPGTPHLSWASPPGGSVAISIYLPTGPVSAGRRERLEFAALAAAAVLRLRELGLPRAEVAAVEERLDDLVDDPGGWDMLARSLRGIRHRGDDHGVPAAQ